MDLAHRDHEDRPWGSFDRLTLNERTTVKLLTCAPGQTLSLQYHNHRSEFWRILSGACIVVLDGVETPAQKDDEFFIPQGTKHRIKTDKTTVEWLELSFGDFDENDIVRLEDSYGRT